MLTRHFATALPPLSTLFDSLAKARGVVLAVSGGSDSTALMHLAAAWRPASLPLWVATVDHGLRPEARREADDVVAAAAALDLPAIVLTWTGDKPETGLQERARTARYALLSGFVETVGASHLVTAHTLDDQAETLLMRLASGSGPAGLAGMRAVSQRGDHILARPFLGLHKATLVTLCREGGWTFVEDPANRDPRFARARWRKLGPSLAAEGLTAERLGHLAARLARAENALQAVATRAAHETFRKGLPRERCFRAELLGHPDDIVLRVLDAALCSIAPGTPGRLIRLETLLATLRQAHGEGRTSRRTLQGCTVVLDAAGQLTIGAEPPRRRGRKAPACGSAVGATFQSR